MITYRCIILRLAYGRGILYWYMSKSILVCTLHLVFYSISTQALETAVHTRLLPDSMFRVRGSESRVLKISHNQLPFISKLAPRAKG
jgi:hypothetical protein